MGVLGGALSETLGKGEIFIYQKGSEVVIFDTATPLGRRNPQLMVQPVNQKQPKTPSPRSAHSRRNAAVTQPPDPGDS